MEARLQLPEHHVGVDQSFLRMTESSGKRSHNIESNPLPQSNCPFVSRDDKIKLHRSITETPRVVEAVYGHGASDSFRAGGRINHKTGIGNLVAAAASGWTQGLSADDAAVQFGDIRFRVIAKPVGK